MGLHSVKSVVITGAGRGLGKAFAASFARDGYAVTLADVNAQDVAGVARDITAAGGRAHAVVADVSSERDCIRIAEEAVQQFGEIGVLINNAGKRTGEKWRFWDVPPDEWAQFLAVNLTGTWMMMRSVLPSMRSRGGGSIINISSTTIFEVPAGQAPYITTKAGIIGLTRAAARELGAENIRVNAIAPSSLDTGIPKGSPDPEGAARRNALKAIPRQEVPEDVIGTALFLASDGSAFLTGQTINVDGGQNFL
jgi:3-oxoacyl-[acyl-carrier protein] reductase